MDTNAPSPDEDPLIEGTDHQQVAEEHDVERLEEVEVDASDFDPRTHWEDPTGVDGILSSDDGDVTSGDNGIHDLGDLGDILPG